MVGQLGRAHVDVGHHSFELGRGERRPELGADRLPPVAAQVHQVLEQPVVHERLVVGHPVAEPSGVPDQDGVRESRVADHQHRSPDLVHPKVPAPVEPPVQRVHDVHQWRPAQHRVANVPEQRRRLGVRHAQRPPLAVVSRHVRVARTGGGRQRRGHVQRPRDDVRLHTRESRRGTGPGGGVFKCTAKTKPTERVWQGICRSSAEGGGRRSIVLHGCQ